MPSTVADPTLFISATRTWLERAVIGLNLCPFAKAVHSRNQIRFQVSNATTTSALLADLAEEMRMLSESDPEIIDTTLLIHPHLLADFLDYNDFLDLADQALEDLQLDGILQIASFHPHYQFAGTRPDDIENYTNRSPYPTLHLLRENSIDRAVETFPDAASIFERNIATLHGLGHAGWRALNLDSIETGNTDDQKPVDQSDG
ncbi:DUF1415 domain-containing protein [Actimicrobium sp. CCI2.3]|uniref:DUF1415 domain-containing protein n=1 Tax=Actimicrobium sp. CCI2.3 TaxID=3048616 RepID=UPI002AB3E276|nr:DUF1415 domain-containing protein [Actimicrobium sp. CCI2.3]MDY7575932.1 DUF1415 domain-containing protein [Actimicrobium sp. CCI2.3]MEB0023200.1 DUF1415 domain-containing protein [Actimicrobium sp. CCI2.3]